MTRPRTDRIERIGMSRLVIPSVAVPANAVDWPPRGYPSVISHSSSVEMTEIIDGFPGSQEPLLPIGFSGGGLSAGRTADGHVMFESVGEDRTTKAITRWYKDNGEIWALTAWSFYKQDEYPHFAYEEAIKDLVSWLQRAVRVSRVAGGTGPFQVMLSASGLRNVIWWQSRPSPGSLPFRRIKDVVVHRAVLKDDSLETAIDAVSGFIEQMTDNFGVPSLLRDQIATLAES